MTRDEMTRRRFVQAAGIAVAASAYAEAQPGITAAAVVDRIKSKLAAEGVVWGPSAFDGFHLGDPNTIVTGIATTFQPTLNVLQRAATSGKNFVGCHESTYWDGFDPVESLRNDAVCQAKIRFGDQHKMAVWRIHDHWHRRRPDPIFIGLARKLDWSAYYDAEIRPRRYAIPEMSLEEVARHIQRRLGTQNVVVVGDRDLRVKTIGDCAHVLSSVLPGLRACDVALVGETPQHDFTGAMKLQFGNLPDYNWMVKCHRDDIYQKICNLTRAANPKWFVMDSLYACQGNGPFSPYSNDLIKDFNTICGGPDPVAVDTICEALMDWDYPGTNVPSTVLGAAEGLGTNRMDEIEIAGVPIDHVKRRFRRQSTILQGQYPNVNVIMGSTCEAGCKAIVRIQLDQLKADGTLDKLQRPLYVFTGLQFEERIQPVDGDVIVVGDCAKPVLERFPGAQYWGECEEYPNCTPIWANRPDVGIASYVRQLAAVQEANTAATL